MILYFFIKKSINFAIFYLCDSLSYMAKTVIEVKKNPNLPTIAILHTGGTMASRVNYTTGGTYASFEVNDLVTMFPELTSIANIESVFVANMMRFTQRRIHDDRRNRVRSIRAN